MYVCVGVGVQEVEKARKEQNKVTVARLAVRHLSLHWIDHSILKESENGLSTLHIDQPMSRM